jgi:polar amino acid transport system substrate-binding protein
MKKYFAMLLAGMMAVSLVACGGSSTASAPAEAPAEAEAEAPAEEETTAAEATVETTEETAEMTTVEAGVLHMATNAAFPPYEMISDNGGFEGIDVEIATEIARKLGLELVVDDMEFGSVITSVQSGKSDIAMAGLTVTEERKQNVDFTTSYATGIQVIIVPEDSDILTVDDLANDKMIGVQDGTTGYIYCSDDYGEDHITSYTNGAMAIEALKGGKVDAVVIDNEPARAFVAANDGLKILDTEYIVENYAIGVSKDNPGLCKAVNDALTELIADGTVQMIVDKYITAE